MKNRARIVVEFRRPGKWEEVLRFDGTQGRPDRTGAFVSEKYRLVVAALLEEVATQLRH